MTSASRTDHVLETIDNALSAATGAQPDAMRWSPDKLQRPAPGLERLRRVNDAIARGQRRFECTADEIKAWLAWSNRFTDDEEISRSSMLLAAVSQQFPPCIGCGSPVYPSIEGAVTIRETDGAGTATFRPCGCVLGIVVPPVLEEIPPGTRCGAVQWRYVPAELDRDPVLRGQILERFRVDLMRSNHSAGTPHVIKLMTLPEAERLLGDHVDSRWRDPNDQLVVAIWLQAIREQTSHIVLRPASDLPDGFLPPRMDGEWLERSGIYQGPFVHIDGQTGRARAVATGRVEIRRDGAVAEVYEISAEWEPDYLRR